MDYKTFEAHYNSIMQWLAPLLNDLKDVLLSGAMIIITIALLTMSATHGCPSEKTRKRVAVAIIAVTIITIAAAIAVVVSHLS